ncbi:hypothetical protein KSP40_PGU000782 [Platanthera guangdongensis]|uniref:Uncharacterized protein n=1 Tax=Platanthera guangdongensis TaxID=2320717 RepID=A0ABR2LD87_9ASPA
MLEACAPVLVFPYRRSEPHPTQFLHVGIARRALFSHMIYAAQCSALGHAIYSHTSCFAKIQHTQGNPVRDFKSNRKTHATLRPKTYATLRAIRYILLLELLLLDFCPANSRISAISPAISPYRNITTLLTREYLDVRPDGWLDYAAKKNCAVVRCLTKIPSLQLFRLQSLLDLCWMVRDVLMIGKNRVSRWSQTTSKRHRVEEAIARFS